MAVPGYVMGRVLVNRMNNITILRKDKAGFRSGGSNIENIFTMRKSHSTNLYVCFVDFEKAFDIVHKDTLWRIMSSYGIPHKVSGMVRVLYGNCSCTVHGGG